MDDFLVRRGSHVHVLFLLQKRQLRRGHLLRPTIETDRDELRNMVPDIKKSEDVPNPAKPNLFSPLVQVSFRILNDLLPKLQQMAKEKGIEDFN